MFGFKKEVLTVDVDNVIDKVQYYIFPGTNVTVCLVKLINGTHVIGKHYGAIDPKKQRWAKSEEMALEDAKKQIKEFEAYLIRQKIHDSQD